MALWGSPWGVGFPWGGVAPGKAFACALVEERVLVQHPDQVGERQFRDWLCAFAEQAGEYLDVVADVKTAFDVDTGVGDQLDLIGGLVGLPRSGFDDPRYRTLLNIQIKLLIGRLPGNADWTGTVNNILAICREFIGAAVVQPVVLQNSPPYSYILNVPGVSPDELIVLIRFICQATWAGVLGQVIVLPLAGDNLWGSGHGAVADSGIWCSDHGVVAGCASWSHVVVIGNSPC
jgi:hypothetical protein